MKKLLCIWTIVLLLAGCSNRQDFETMTDQYSEPFKQSVGEIMLQLPEEALQPVLSQPENGKFFLCDGYELHIQTMEAGDLDRTIRQVTGYAKDALMIIETSQGEMKRYDCAWSSAGENAVLTCRASILDDGAYHYVVSVMANADTAGDLQETWKSLFDTFAVIDTAA